MSRLATILPLVLLSTLVRPAAATTYRVGPGHPYAGIGNVPWESLAPGDSVLIHARPAPYAEKWVICRVGTATQPIVVRGIPDGSGNLPVIEGANATTRTQLNFWSENRGIIKVGGANNPPDTMPAWIVIENLDIKGARSTNSYTGRSGVATYGANASAIYVEKGQHIVVRGCRFHDCGNGFFCAWQTTDLLVEGCRIDDNGNVGSIFEHNNYTEAFGIVFQYNWFGVLRAGAGGNNLKDRSAGQIVRYNWIEGGNRQLDLVDSDFPEIFDDPSYRNTFVYGNVLLEKGDDGNSQIVHYGGDSGTLAQYRKGTLWFHHNTVVSRRTGNTTLMRLSSASEAADVRNNIVFVTAAGNRLGILDQTGTATLTKNWLKTGWINSHSGVANVFNNGQVTGSDPGFVNAALDSFELKATSPARDQAAALIAPVTPDHVPVRQYVKHQSHMARPDDGLRDIGAYEYAVPGGVPDAGGLAPPILSVFPNPSRGPVTIQLAAGPLTQSPLWIFDMQGRLVARVEATAARRWTWKPNAGTAPGVYFARLGAVTGRVILER